MRALIALAIAGILGASPSLAAQQSVSNTVEAAAMRQVAGALPPGTRVRIQMQSGRRLTATLLSVEADAIIVKRDARVPEPAVTIPFSELAQLQRDQKSGFSIAKAIALGLAVGAGAMLTIFGIAVALD